MANLTDLYFRLPVFMQNAATYMAALKIKRERYRDPFPRILEEYKKRGSWSADQLQAFQSERLQKMIAHCYETVPYYTRLFKERDLDPYSINGIDDLAVLPVLTKEDVRKCPDDFISSEYKGRRLIHSHTSGSTGSAFQFVMTRRSIMEQWAVVWRFWENLGIPFGTMQAKFGQRLIVPPDRKKPPFWRSKAPVGECYFSAFHESDDNLMSYFKEIDDKGYVWIHGFPSLVTALAAFMVENGLKLSTPLRHLTLSSENLLPHQRRLMIEAFGVEPRSHYACSEGVANASQGVTGVEYRIDEDYAAVEVLKDDAEKESGIVVGTTLTNFAMPLLRWRLNDLATLRIRKDGARFLDSIDGREEDRLLMPSGTRIGRIDHLFKDTTNFKEAQIRQADDYSIEILVSSLNGRAESDEAIVLDGLRQSGCDVPIAFKYVNSVPKTQSGKLRLVISELDIAE